MRTLKRSRLAVFLACFMISSLPAIAQISTVDTTDQFGEKVRVELNSLTGTAHRIWWSNPNIEIFGFSRAQLNERNVAALARAILLSYQDLLKVGPDHLSLQQAETDGDNWYISFEQRYKNLPVYGASAGLTINAEGKIISIGADAYPEVQVSTVPSISEEQAEEIARTEFSTAEMDTVFLRKPIPLLVFPDSSLGYHLAYEVELQSNLPLKGIRYFVDAHTGSMVDKEEIFKDGTWNISGNVSGQYWPETENVNTTTEVPKYLSALSIVNILGQTVTTGTINSSGNYSITFNAAFGTYFLKSDLKGSWIKVNNVTHSFQFTSSSSTVHNFQFSAGNEGYNVYHHGNVVHDFFKGSPFNYNGMDYQMVAEINAGSGINGAANGTNIFFGTQNNILWWGASDVVYHEYTHNTVYHLYGNRFIGSGSNYQGFAMDEGLSDYFAATINANSFINLVNRDLSPNKRFPEDFTNGGDPHTNGLIIGGAAWDLQQPSGVGVNTGRKLIFKALQMTPHAFNFTDFVNNVILADDNNGTLCDQTPNTSAILTAFQTNHGISPTNLPSLSVTISGPGSIQAGTQGTWTANVCGGSGTISYQWSVRYEGSSNFTNLGTSQNQSLTFFDECTINDLKVDVVRGGQSAQDLHTVIVTNGPIFCKRGGEDSGAEELAQIPDKFDLHQNYPNPFNPTTEIKYDLPQPGEVTLTIFNIVGQRVRTLVDGPKTAGYHSVRWDGKDDFGNEVASGVYVYRIRVLPNGAESRLFESAKKMTIMR